MPLTLAREDRRLLLVAAGVFAVTVLGAFVLTPGPEAGAKLATTYSTASEGTKAAYLLLRESGYQCQRWERPPNQVVANDKTVLLILDPSTAPAADDQEAALRFVNNGGTLVLSGPLGVLFMPQHAPTPDVTGLQGWQTFAAVTPSVVARQAPHICLDTTAYWARDSSGIALYGDENRNVVMQYPTGKGQVIWIASSSLVSNAGMKEPGNMEFLLATLGGRDRRILWDEYFHGHHAENATLVAHPQMPWLFAQLALLSVAVLFTFSRRSGPVRTMPSESRLSPLEFVQALGNLYSHVQAANVAVDIYYGRFRYWLTKRLGMATNASPEELARAVHDRWQLSDPDFLVTLKACESVRFYSDLPRAEALQLVRKLYRYAAELKLFPMTNEEKA